jgi:hypothetical protein
MQRLVDVEQKSVDAAIYDVQKKFGENKNKRRKCLEALEEARRHNELCAMVDAAS